MADGPEPFTVGLRQTEQLTNDPKRDRESERLDQIDAGARRLDHVQLLIDNLTDPRLQLTQSAHGELGREELAQTRVIGRVGRSQTSDGIHSGSIRPAHQRPNRSEERRVGKECRARRSTSPEKKKEVRVDKTRAAV